MDVRDVMDIAFARRAVLTGEAQAIREAAELHQADIARSVGVASATVCRWESQDRMPTGAAAIRYARLLRRLQRQVARATAGAR